ncbi:MAG: DUF4365 domain-containing protein [Treponema sp.]|nr:DUF4365 domain-containing protein [Treponema sp.]
MINTERIEIRAKAKLEDCLSKSAYVLPELSSNDKSPSWDGCIRLYNKRNSSKKEDLVRRIPVQIKGHFSSAPYNNEISFPVDIADLNNYMKECGAIYFVIYVDDKDNYKIYYDTLTRLKIRRIIKGKESQETVSIHLQSFPTDAPYEIADIFFNFAKDMDMAFPKNDITMDYVIKRQMSGFDSFNLSYSGVAYKNDPWAYFLNHPTTLALQNSTLGIKIPIDTVVIQSIGSKVNKPISIAGVVYYDAFEILRQGNSFVLSFGKSFTISLSQVEGNIKEKFSFTIRGNLNERIRDIKFLLAYLEHKELSFGNHKGFFLDSDEVSNVDISYYCGSLNLLEKIDGLLKKLRIETPLDYDKVSEKDEETLILLINTVLLGATCVPDQKNVLYNLQIANINILLVANKMDDNNYTIVNYFSDENRKKHVFSYTYKDKANNSDFFLIPLTFILGECDFASLDNIDYDMVYNDIITSQTSDELKEYTYFFVQEMFAGFFKRTKNNGKLLECIKKSLCFLKENVPDFGYEELWENFMNECTEKAKNII